MILGLPGIDILASAGVSSIIVIVIFVLMIYIIKIILISEAASYERWERAIWISTITVFFILLLNAIGVIVLQQPVVPFII